MYQKPTLTPYEKFVNMLMLAGKKSVAQRVMNEAMDLIKEKGAKDPQVVFDKALENVKPILEVKARRIGGSNYQIPMEVNPKRQQALAFRWIIGAARDKKGRDMAHRLADELWEASQNQGNAIKKREDTHRMAEANKAFAHFAKYI